MTSSKSYLASKTVWFNLLGPVFLWLGTKYGIEIDVQTQAEIVLALMTLGNLILRKLTRSSVHMKRPPGALSAVLLAVLLAACTTPGGIIDSAVDAAVKEGLTVEDAQGAATVFRTANNPAGARCMDYLAGKMLEIRTIRAGLGDAKPGPLTSFAIAHSAIETVQNRDLGAFGDACGALRMQIRDNATGASALVRKLLLGV